jgi:REP element-mobilizing transposase RayT
MPDHWHGLIELRGNESLSACIGRCKGRSARALRLRHPWLGPIWSDGFHDRALRESDGIASAARYVVMNPVRAGLAESVRDYPFWNAIWF